MRIAVLANLKKNAPTWEGMSADQWDDLDSPTTIQALLDALQARGHQAEFLEASILPPHHLVRSLQEMKPELCFNIAEGHFGDGREAQIPAILEMLQLPYTGSRVLTLALALDKPMTKRILWYHGLPTPEFQVFDQADEPIDADLLDEDEDDLRFPMFVKPSREGTSMGVSAESVVHTVDQLYVQVESQLKRYRQPILVEHYIKGREITVGLVGNIEAPAARRLSDHAAPDVLPEGIVFFPALEINTDVMIESEGRLYTNRMKVEWADDERLYLCPAPLDPDVEHHLRMLAAAVFRVTGCKDVARVDFRLDEENDDKPYILEVNPLPGLNPGYSDLCMQARAAGWTYERLVNTIVDQAVARYRLPPQSG
jgi:D-alanine-D-alanine ligase